MKEFSLNSEDLSFGCTHRIFLVSPCHGLFLSGLILSMSQPCLHNGSPIGVSGIDLHVADLVQEITYYNPEDGSYSFMVNENGKSGYYCNSLTQIYIHLRWAL